MKGKGHQERWVDLSGGGAEAVKDRILARGEGEAEGLGATTCALPAARVSRPSPAEKKCPGRRLAARSVLRREGEVESVERA